jgi:hypothetical protein
MSLFQTSVVKKYLNDLSPELIDKKYNEFQAYFGNAERQENIRNLKEEEFQEGFIRELFVSVLGYTLNPEPNFNFVLEKKNVDDSKKADGAILKDENVIAVIELKSTKITDLSKVEIQAFGYKVHNPKCQYIITSNFEKIRFYIQNTTEYLEYDLFNLSKEDFAMLWLCLSKDNILSDIPLKIKEASVLQEENVTKKLYKDYSKFREEIFANIVKNNNEFDKLVLFKKTQKLLDRFLFIFFAEDRLLVPPNSINQIIDKWKDDVDFGDDKPLYSIFKQYFHVLNVGRPKSGKRQEIFAYNGGLFLPDEILDNIKIDDEVLHQNTVKLSTYDFETEVDVNILGHIFEHSLGEIENVQAEIAGEEIDKQKTKRKKDGIFYTPKYITKYIVENTVGKLCEEKRTEIGIIDEEYAKGRRNRKKDIVRNLDNKLIKYREWLLEITILDPACGSGAFLNQALEFLIQEHKKIDELKAQLLGGSIIFPDIEAKILEKNIYGVDLNEESVEIAKLSLWLRTAQKGRKLTTLSNHIICGNSLIDDTEVAGEKAFNWQNEFPEVFEKGGFDVVIGNPPYGASLNIKEKDFIKEKYYSMEGDFDTYIYFMELSLNILIKGGECGLIIPNNILIQKFGRKLRELLLKKTNITSIIDLGYGAFEDAVVPTTVITYKYINSTNSNENRVKFLFRPKRTDFNTVFDECYQNDFFDNQFFAFNIQTTPLEKALIKKMDKQCENLQHICELKIGIEGDQKYINDNPISSISKPMVRGRNFYRYRIDFESNPKYIEYDRKLLHRAREERLFDCPQKILIRQTGDKVIGTIDESRLYAWKSVFVILPINDKLKLEYLLGLLNSKLIDFYYQKLVGESGRAFAQVKGVNLNLLPIKIESLKKQEDLIFLVKNALLNGEKLTLLDKKFKNYLLKTYINELTKKLQNWYDLSFVNFINEIQKANIKGGAAKLTKTEELEWMEIFETKKSEAQTLKTEIKQTENEIDQMVYSLYGLTEEEINIVEESISPT